MIQSHIQVQESVDKVYFSSLSVSVSVSNYIFAMQVQHKHLTPQEAYAYVKSIRPRVKLATAQWKVINRSFSLFFFIL